jgi:hypothetical protein
VSLTNPSAPSTGADKPLPWGKLIRLTAGMTMLGGGGGLSFPFAADVIAWGPGPHRISVVALLGALPLMAGGIRLIAAALGLKALQMDLLP